MSSTHMVATLRDISFHSTSQKSEMPLCNWPCFFSFILTHKISVYYDNGILDLVKYGIITNCADLGQTAISLGKNVPSEKCKW